MTAWTHAGRTVDTYHCYASRSSDRGHQHPRTISSELSSWTCELQVKRDGSYLSYSTLDSFLHTIAKFVRNL
jgi:hypothetical protein